MLKPRALRSGDRLAIARDSVTVQEAILAMTRAKSGSIALVSAKGGRLTGILTDGDFRRSALTGPDFLRQRVSGFMTRNPKVIRDDALGQALFMHLVRNDRQPALHDLALPFHTSGRHLRRKHHHHDCQEIDNESSQHRAHVVEEVHRTETKTIEVAVQRLGRVQVEHFVDVRIQVEDLECSNCEDLVEESLRVGRHTDLEEWHHDDELLRVDHAPQLIQGSRPKHGK